MEQFNTTKELRDYARRDRGATEEYVPKVLKEEAKETPKKKGTKNGEEK